MKTKKNTISKILSLIIACVLVFSLTSCKNSPSNEPQSTDSSSQESIEESSSSEEISSSNQDNTNSQEQRIVATSVSVVEILDKLGVPMVGIPTSTYTLPESVKDAAEIGNPMSPDMEVIKSLNPTLVISVAALEGTLGETFNSLNISAEFVDLTSYDGLVSSIEQLGASTDTSDKAKEIIDEITGKVNTVTNNVADKDSPNVLIIFGASGSFQVATELSYVGDLVKKAGGTNIIENPQSGFIPVDMEFLANKNPDYILLMAHANPEETKASFEQEFSTNSAWDSFNAVKNDKVIVLEPGYFGMSANILAADALEKLEVIFYGENK